MLVFESFGVPGCVFSFSKPSFRGGGTVGVPTLVYPECKSMCGNLHIDLYSDWAQIPNTGSR